MLFRQKFYQSMWVTISSTILVKLSQKFEFKIWSVLKRAEIASTWRSHLDRWRLGVLEKFVLDTQTQIATSWAPDGAKNDVFWSSLWYHLNWLGSWQWHVLVKLCFVQKRTDLLIILVYQLNSRKQLVCFFELSYTNN